MINKRHLNQHHFAELKILKIKNIIRLENLKFAFKLNNDLLPEQIKNCVLHDHHGKTLVKQHAYNTRFKKILNTPKIRTKHYRESLLCKSTKEFRILKGVTQNLPMLSAFVRACKDTIIQHV